MIGDGGLERDLAGLVVPGSGRLVATGDRYEPYQLIGPDGAVMEAAAGFFRDLLAAGRAESTVRSYAYDLLRWLRFLDAADVSWDRATRVDARDFQPVASGRGQAAFACAGAGVADARGPAVCTIGARAFGDCAAGLL